MLLASITTKRSPCGRVSTADRGSMRRSIAFTHGPQARKRSATAWSVMDSYRAVKVPATSRKDLSKPQYKKTTRKSCAGVLTFLARTNALNSRAICTVSGGRSCKSSSKSVSGSVRGNCMRHFSCRRQGKIFTSCSMPSFSLIYSLSWRKWPLAPGIDVLHDVLDEREVGPRGMIGGADEAAGRLPGQHHVLLRAGRRIPHHLVAGKADLGRLLHGGRGHDASAAQDDPVGLGGLDPPPGFLLVEPWRLHGQVLHRK